MGRQKIIGRIVYAVTVAEYVSGFGHSVLRSLIVNEIGFGFVIVSLYVD